MIRTNQ